MSNIKKLLFILNSGLFGNKRFTASIFSYTSCHLGKGKTHPFPIWTHHAFTCFDFITCWCLDSPILSWVGYKYFIIFVDDYSHYTWVYFLHSKSDVYPIFQQFVSMIENQVSTCIKQVTILELVNPSATASPC